MLAASIPRGYTHRLHSGHDGGHDEHRGEDDHDPVGEVVNVEVEGDPAAHHQEYSLEGGSVYQVKNTCPMIIISSFNICTMHVVYVDGHHLWSKFSCLNLNIVQLF